MITTLLTSFLALAQGAVTLEIKGERLETALPKIAKAIQAPALTVSPTLKDEVMVIRTKNTDPETFKKKLLQSLNASLVLKDSSWHIEQTPEQVAADFAHHQKLMYDKFDRLTTAMRERLSKLKPFDRAEAIQLKSELEALSKFPVTNDNISPFSQKVGAADQKGPIKRFAAEVIGQLTAKDWMQVTDSRPRVVLCNKPNQLQFPVELNLQPLIQRAITAQATWASVAGGEPLKGPPANGSSNAWYGLGTTNDMRRELSADDFALITIKQSIEDQMVEVSVYDQQGKMLGSCTEYMFQPVSTDPKLAEEYAKYMKVRVELVGDQEEFLKRYNRERPAGQDGPMPPLTPSLKARMMDPVTYEPMAAAAEVALKCTTQENIVAVLDDRLMGTRRFSPEYAILSRGNDGTVSIESNWVTYRPVDPFVGRRDRADRPKLRSLLQAIEASGGEMPLDQRAAFAYALPWEASAATYYNQYLNALNAERSYGTFASPVLRIYGAMNASERNALATGIPLNKLSQDAQRELYRLLLYKDGTGSYTESYFYDPNEDRAAMERYQMLRYNGIFREITFLLGDGFKENQTLVGSLTNSTVLEMKNEAGSQNPISYLPVRMVGDLLFKRKHPEKYKIEIESYPFREDSIRVSKSVNLNFWVKVTKSTTFQPTSNQTSYVDRNVYTLQNLPADIRQEIKAAYDQAEKNYNESNGTVVNNNGDGKSKIPPP